MPLRPLPYLALLATLLVPPNALAQRAVDSRNQNFRVMVVVPLVGKGTFADPVRPAFSPATTKQLSDSGILSYQWEASDDGKYAIVEYAARSRAPLLALLRDSRLVVGFEKGRVKKDDVEKVLRKYKRDFAVDAREEKNKK
jgi:hypothetical protein